jgi:hypothetical protein
LASPQRHPRGLFLKFVTMFEKALNAVEHMDRLTAFGLIVVGLCLVFYALEDRSRFCVLAFSGVCARGSVYGFLQGA